VSVTIGEGGARIRLTPPAATGGSPVVAYSVTALPSGRRVVIEGRDIIHSDAEHPVARTIPGFLPDPAGTVAVSAINAKGEGLPALVKPER
jgi:hypothetical protein